MDRVAEYLTGKTVLVTGATGFLGQPLVEKILWSSPDVKRIVLLIRPKRPMGGDLQTPQERLQRQLFTSSIFDRLRFRHGDALESFLEEKIVAVGGDVSEDNLGLDPDDRSHLLETVDVIINGAAVVSFDAPLDEALELNTLGAGRMATFAAECDHAVLIHVSTAYVCGATDARIPETLHHSADLEAIGSQDEFPLRQFRDPELDIARIRELIDEAKSEGNSDEVRRELVRALVDRRRQRGGRRDPRRQTIENLRARWIKNRLVEAGMTWARLRGWNDTYTYTKALGEQAVMAHRGGAPTAIVRPAIIESCLHEPSPGWLDGLRMADPLIAAIGKGRLRALPLDPEVTLDLVPADMVVNAILAAIPKTAEDGGTAIYQVATGSRNPAKMERLHDLIIRYFQANPMLDKDGNPIRVRRLRFPKPRTFRLVHRSRDAPLSVAESTLERLIHWNVAVGKAQKLRRRIAGLRAALGKLHYFGQLYEPYLNLDCRFQVDNTMRLFEWLNAEERRKYNFDVTRINWRHYMHVHIGGVKKHILKVERAGTLEVDDEAASHEASLSTINDVLDRTAERHPNKMALRILRDGEWVEYSYAELRQVARDVGHRFRRLGFRKGDRVVLLSENQPEWGIAFLGAASRGLVVVPLDAATWHHEVWSTARFVGARAILLSRKCFDRLGPEGLRGNEASEEPIALLDVDALCAPLDAHEYPISTRLVYAPRDECDPEEAQVDPDDVASIIFTTGTAADPRGVVHTHRNFLSNMFSVSRYLPVTEEDHFLSVLPLYHALEFTCGFLSPIYRGSTVTYSRSLKPKVIIETMRETGISIMLGVPTLYALLRDDIERRILRGGKSQLRANLMEGSKRFSRSWERRFNRNIGRQLFARVHEELGGRIRFLVSGGSALGDELYENFRDLGLSIYEGYGLTETAPVLTVNPLYQSRPGSAGKPLPGVELRLFHTDSRGVGEIIVQSPSMMKGYYANREATDRVLVDGWFHTGDLGWVDEDGFIYITGRIKDVIVTGAGKNVYPIDLEAIYRRIPEIGEICVVGVRSGLTEDVHGVIEPDLEVDRELSPDEVRQTIHQQIQRLGRELPSYHRLQHVHVLEEPLPRREDGSVDRQAVKRGVVERSRGETRTEIASRPSPNGGPEAEVLTRLSRLSITPESDISEATHLYEDLGLDSLQAIELLLFLEHELNVSIDDRTAESLKTVGQLLDVVRARPREGSPVRTGRRSVRSERPYSDRPPIDRWILGSFGVGLGALYRSYLELDLRNPERIPEESPYLLAANHASHLDTPAILSAIRRARGSETARRVHVLGARDYFFDTPVKSWFFSTFLNVVPIEREETSLAGLRTVQRILESGESALIFPEGTRSRSGAIQPFKPGLGLIAWQMDTPVVPVHIEGTFQAMPVGSSMPRRGRVTITFGQPIAMDRYREAADHLPNEALYRAIAGDVREAILNLSGEGRSEAGQPPRE